MTRPRLEVAEVVRSCRGEFLKRYGAGLRPEQRRVLDDPRLNAKPQVKEAHHRVSRASFKYLATEMVCWATGGPQKYSGRSMRESHAHLGITEEEWQVFLDDFRAW